MTIDYTPKINLGQLREDARKELEQLHAFYTRRRTELEELCGKLPEEPTGSGEPTECTAPRSAELAECTIPAAAVRVLRAAGQAQSTRQIFEAMKSGGKVIEDKKSRAIQQLHSALAQTPYVRRVGRTWELTDRGRETQL
jgi:hypothetical protein